MQITDPEIHYAISLLKIIARTRAGELAGSCGETLWAIARPQAIRVIIELEGLDPDVFERGGSGEIAKIDKLMKDYGLDSLKADRRFPDYLSVTSDDERLLCAAVIKHLGNPVGIVAAVSDFRATSKFPPEESLYLTASQLGARIHAILTPGSRSAMDITGRRLLGELSASGVRGICIGSYSAKSDWNAITRTEKGISSREIDGISAVDIEKINNGDALDKSILDQFWPGQSIAEAIWITDLPGHNIAIGFAERKDITKQSKTAIKSAIEKMTVADADYIIKSFEKLKSDFKKLVISERAAAITETAVTVNHEINNPLTAILGNTQLLLMNESELPRETVAKLKTIERSAVQIRETTGKLMSIIEPVRTPYASGLNMIDIESSKKKEK